LLKTNSEGLFMRYLACFIRFEYIDSTILKES